MTSPVRHPDLDAAPERPVEAVLALGSNLGDRLTRMQGGTDGLDAQDGVDVLAISPVVETAPVGGPAQEDYLNAVVVVHCRLSARDLLAACQRVETGQGRERTVRWGPRTLDIDVITYGSLVSSAKELTLPHPRAHQRAFVLAPWAELDPGATLPGPGGGPVALLAAQAPDAAGVRVRRDVMLRLPSSAVPHLRRDGDTARDTDGGRNQRAQREEREERR